MAEAPAPDRVGGFRAWGPGAGAAETLNPAPGACGRIRRGRILEGACCGSPAKERSTARALGVGARLPLLGQLVGAPFLLWKAGGTALQARASLLARFFGVFASLLVL